MNLIKRIYENEDIEYVYFENNKGERIIEFKYDIQKKTLNSSKIFEVNKFLKYASIFENGEIVHENLSRPAGVIDNDSIFEFCPIS